MKSVDKDPSFAVFRHIANKVQQCCQQTSRQVRESLMMLIAKVMSG